MDLRWLLRLYPHAWRARYEDEMRALLEQRPATIAAALDLLLGALDAHLDPAALGAGAPAGPVWTLRVRSASRLVFWSFPLFIFLWSVIFLDKVDGAWDTLRETDPVVGAASTVTSTGALAAALTTIATGLLLAVSRLRAPGPLRKRIRRALVPVLPPIFIALAFAAHALWLRGHPWGAIPPFVFFWLNLLALPIIVGRAVARDDLSEREVRLTLAGATIVGLGMLAQLSGMLVSQAVASVVWPGGNWSVRLVAGFPLLVLPVALGLSALGRGYAALRAARAA